MFLHASKHGFTNVPLQTSNLLGGLFCWIFHVRLAQLADVPSLCRCQGAIVSWMVKEIRQAEPKAERSLMHRFNLAKVLLFPGTHCCQ